MACTSLVSYCEETSLRVRKHILSMTQGTGATGAHLGGSLSAVELLVGLYSGVLRYRVDDPGWEGRDRVILSKGHAALALYPAMAEAGIIGLEELATFKRDGSRLGGHPSLNGLPGVEFASGSLGQGLSLGVGVCLALKRKGNDTSRAFVVLGDGECNEGSVWEAAASASHFELDNLVAIVDVNAIQYDGETTAVLNMAPFGEKWRAFGWNAVDIDGHDMGEVLDAYLQRSSRPLAILAHTTKGKGISYMEGNWRYHNASLTRDQYERALVELEAHV